MGVALHMGTFVLGLRPLWGHLGPFRAVSAPFGPISAFWGPFRPFLAVMWPPTSATQTHGDRVASHRGSGPCGPSEFQPMGDPTHEGSGS